MPATELNSEGVYLVVPGFLRFHPGGCPGINSYSSDKPAMQIGRFERFQPILYLFEIIGRQTSLTRLTGKVKKLLNLSNHADTGLIHIGTTDQDALKFIQITLIKES